MNLTDHGFWYVTKKSMIGMAAAAAMLFLTATPGAKAETFEERCQRRIQHAEHELHEAVERHGRHSRKADHERRELRAERERCWREHHQWWDEHEHRWRTDRWDDRDHDRDDYR